MGFWIFMTACVLIVPVTMIGFGSRFCKRPPGQINSVFGYRTSMSMKNRHTWDFAHTYCGRLWRGFGWVLLALGVIVMLFVLGKPVDTVGAVGGIAAGVQCVLMCLTIIPVERALRKNFDLYGRKKHKEN